MHHCEYRGTRNEVVEHEKACPKIVARPQKVEEAAETDTSGAAAASPPSTLETNVEGASSRPGTQEADTQHQQHPAVGHTSSRLAWPTTPASVGSADRTVHDQVLPPNA